MKFKVGDKVRITCDVIGTVMKDPVMSDFSVLIDFDGQVARLPGDGTLMGLNCVHLEKVEDDE